MQKKYARLGRLLASGLVFMAMFAYVIWLTSADVAAKTAVSATMLPQDDTANAVADISWCAAGDFNSWDNGGQSMYDDGTNGDIVSGDGIYSFAYTYAVTGTQEWKAFECGTWSGHPSSGNSWLHTETENQEITFLLDTNDHSGDAGTVMYPAQYIVHAWGDDLPDSFTAAGDFNSWNNADAATQMVNEGNGMYRLELLIPTSGSYIGKVTETGTWNAYGLNGRSTDAGNLSFTTATDNETVVFLLDTNTSRVIVTQHDAGSGSHCLAGDFNSWNNGSHPMFDDGTNGDLLGNDGIFSLDFEIGAASRQTWKVFDCGTWDSTMPENGWAFTTVASQTVKFTYDVNDHSNDSGWPYYPMQNIPNAWDDMPATFTAVGDWQGWDPNNAATAMAALGNNQYVYSQTLTAGQYVGKATNDDWNNQMSVDGRSINGGNIPFEVFEDNDLAVFWIDGNTGRMAIITLLQGGVSLDVTVPVEGQTFVSPNFDVMGSVVPTTAVTVTVNLNNTNLYTPTVDGGGDFAQPVTLPIGNSVITVTADNGVAPTVVVRNVSFGAGHDNDIWWGQLGHNSRDTAYRTPEAAVITGTAVSLRLRAASNDLTAAKARVYNDLTNTETFYDMAKVADDGQYEWWEVTLPASDDPTIYWYWFTAIDGTETVYYQDDSVRDGGQGEAMDENLDRSWQITVYDPSFKTPDWVKDAIIYQIFPDRFQNGDVSNDPTPGRFFYNESGSILRSNTTFTDTNAWNTVVCDPREVGSDCEGYYSHNFYGGDLQGVINELDYLEDLGVTAIYFNPLFESPSNHKYDTANYETIAADFGDLQTFITLTEEAHDRGMYIILDGVFNHTSSDSSYFDRYSNFPEVGACESETSPYRDWYYFTDVTPGTGDCVGSDGTAAAANYESWFGYDSLPKLNAGNQGVRDYIFAGTQDGDAIALQWMLYADGWRFDVGGDIDPGATNDPENLFWEEFRAMLHAEYPDRYMVIEEWGNASSWLLGNEMDATMNYPYGTAMMGFWRDTTFVDNDHNSGSSAGEIVPLSPSEIDGRLHNWIERYPPEAMYAMMNLLGSHDTNRPMFMLDHNAADAGDDSLLQDPAYDWSDSIIRQKGVALLQMTLPGAPTLYYGDEVGLVGPTYYHGGKWEDDPYNRQPFPWLGGDNGLPFYNFLQEQGNQDDMYGYYQLLMAARNGSPALRIGSFDTLLLDDANGVYAYGRKMADNSDAAIVIASRAGTIDVPVTLTVTVDVAGYVPVGAIFTDTLNGGLYTVNASGLLTVIVPGQSGALLLLDAPIAQAPTAVSLNLVAEADSSVVISWTMAATATSYDLYRSELSGSAGVMVTNTTDLVYTDTGLMNAQPYYYTIVSRDDMTGLTSDPSNEVMGVPHHNLDWYNLQWPHEFTHTISAITRTETIYAQLYIAGATGDDGPAEGVSAQIGYAISGTNPITPTLWTWVDMEYQGIASGNDQYMTTLLPSAIGTYQYFARWSTDGGSSWYDADIDGPGAIDNPGVMHVIPSGDSTSPVSTTLYLAGTTAGSIGLSWDVVADGDLSGYELYRQNVTAPGYALAATVGLTTTYVDEGVITGETYQYYVKAFDTSFNRADASNVISATAEARFVEVTFRVAVPANTPGTVYVVGDLAEFGPWNPGHTPMNQVGSTDVWTYTVNILDGTALQYKYTRGNWDTVESWGSIVGFGNRDVLISYGTDGTQLVDNTATDWGTGLDSSKAVQFWVDPFVTTYAPTGTGVDVNSPITVTWSMTMTTDTDFEVMGSDGVVSGTFVHDVAAWMVTFTPDAPLTGGGAYTVTAADQTSLALPGGNPGTQQVTTVWSFVTELLPVEVTFRVAVPAHTPGTVYIMGDLDELGSWDPSGTPMNQVGSSDVWTYTVNILDGTVVEYRYTRGSLETVESWGSIVGSSNRDVLISYGADGTQLVDNTATDWGTGSDSTKAVRFWRDPFVTAYAPTGMDVNANSPITVTWSMTMTANTDFEVMGSDGVVSGTFVHDVAAWTVTFTPDAPLTGGGTYTVTAADQTSLALPGGNPGTQQVTTVWTFTTMPYMVYMPVIIK